MGTLDDLITPISSQTDEELMERLRSVRARREVIRPAAIKRQEKAARPARRAATKRVEGLIGQLTPEQRAELIKQLEAD